LTAGLGAPPAVSDATGWRTAVAVAAGGLAATLAGTALSSSDASLRLVLVPAVLVAGVLAVAAALFRFEAFLLGALVVRSSLDALGGAASRATEPATALGALFLAAGLAWLFVNRARLHRPSPVTWAALAFTAAAALSLPGSAAPSRGLLDLVRIAGAVLLLVVVEQVVRGDPARRRLLAALVASAAVPLAVLASQSLTGASAAVRGDVSRFTGTFNHPNPFAAYLGLLAVTFLAVRTAVGGRWSGLYTAAAVACGAGLLATYARGAWVGAVIGVVVVAALVDRRLLARLAVLVVAVVVLVPSVGARITDLEGERHLSGTAGNSLTWRLDYWGEVLDLAGNPVTGIGLTGVSARLTTAVPPHNDFLRVYVETGLMGLAAYGALLGAMGWVAWRAARRAPTRLGRAMGVAATGCVAAFLWLSVSSNLISQVVVLWYLWAPLGAAAAALSEAEAEP
jgi:O-antigen ligase